MVFKVEKNKNYTVMSNYHLRDKSLSLKAKGLLSFMLSLPDDWDYSLAGLCSICKEGKDAIRSTLKELKDNNYLVIEKSKNDKGLFEYTYIIYEEPHIEKELGYPDTENPYMDNPDMDNPTQINTNKQNTKEQNDKDDKEKSSFFDLNNLNPLTKDLIEKDYVSDMDVDLFQYDELFNKLLSEYSYQELIKISHYITNKVIKNKFKDEEGNLIENKYNYFKASMYSNIEKLESLEQIEWDDETGWYKENDELELEY